jgi:hypothetical protein
MWINPDLFLICLYEWHLSEIAQEVPIWLSWKFFFNNGETKILFQEAPLGNNKISWK